MAKRGLSKEREKFIRDHLHDMSAEKIATSLKIPLRKVKKTIDELRRQETPRAEQRDELIESDLEFPAIGATSQKRIFVVLMVVIALATLFVYLPSLNNDFIWDDEYLILNNTNIRSFSHLGDIFKHYLGYASGNVNNFYRPLQEFTYFIDYALWQYKPKGYHLITILLHCACAVLAYLFAFFLTKNTAVAFLTGFLFGVHPVNSEAVVYIAGRADPLYLLFFLASLLSYLVWATRLSISHAVGEGVFARLLGQLAFGASVLFFVMAILSKEVALVLPFVILLIQKVFFPKATRTNPRLRFSSVPFFLVVLCYGFFRTRVLTFPAIRSDFARIPTPLRLFSAAKAIPTYFRFFVLPIDLHMERRMSLARSLFEPGTLFAVLFVLGLLIVSVWFLVRGKERFVSFGILWFFINIFPVSNVIPINSFIAEHWIYAASIGIYILVWKKGSEVVDRLKGGAGNAVKLTLAIPLLLFLLFLMSVTMDVCKNWKDEVSFFKTNLKYSPNNPKLHLNFGNTYYEKGMFDKALEEYKKVISLAPTYHEAYGNIGAVYIDQRKFDEAESYFKKALSIKEDVHTFHYALGDIYEATGRADEAIKEYKRCIEILPTFYYAYNRIAGLLAMRGDRAAAEAYLKKSLELNPNQPKIKDILRTLK